MKKDNQDNILSFGKAIHERREQDKQLDQAITNVENLIDEPVTDTCRFLEGLSVGELRGIRTIIEQKLLEVDAMGAHLLDTGKPLVTDEEKQMFGSIYGVAGRIVSKMGIVDYFIDKKSLNRKGKKK